MLSQSYNPFFTLKPKSSFKKKNQSDAITSLLKILYSLPVALKTNAKFFSMGLKVPAEIDSCLPFYSGFCSLSRSHVGLLPCSWNSLLLLLTAVLYV